MASKRPAEEADDEGDARTVFVGNLPHQTTDLDLIEIFGKQGTVVAETIPHHRDGPHEGKPRGFAFVQMKTAGEAAAAVRNLDGRLLRGRKLVLRAKSGEDPASKDRRAAARAGDTAAQDAGKPDSVKRKGREDKANAAVRDVRAKLAALKRAKR